MTAHISADLRPEVRVRAVTLHDVPTLSLGGPGDTTYIDLCTYGHRGQAANAELWRSIASAANALAVACDDLAAVSEVTA